MQSRTASSAKTYKKHQHRLVSEYSLGFYFAVVLLLPLLLEVTEPDDAADKGTDGARGQSTDQSGATSGATGSFPHTPPSNE